MSFRLYLLLWVMGLLLCIPPSVAAQELRADQWVTIGQHGCWGMPDVVPDREDPNSLFITWQRYRDEAEKIMDVKYASLDLRTRRFTPEAYLIDPGATQVLQAHPTIAFWHGAYRLFYCECEHGDPRGRIVEISAGSWPGFRNHKPSAEHRATPELGFHSHVQFLPLGDSRAWLFYTTGNRADKICYSVMQQNDERQPEPRPVPTAALVGEEKMTLGSTFLLGRDPVLYSSTYEISPQGQTSRHGIAWRFRHGADSDHWSADKLTVTGIDEPFQKAGMFFVRVVRMGGKFYLSALSNRSHRYLAAGDDGLHFQVIRDFGERPSLGNAMFALEGRNALLLIYADATNGIEKLGGNVECMLAPLGEKK